MEHLIDYSDLILNKTDPPATLKLASPSKAASKSKLVEIKEHKEEEAHQSLMAFGPKHKFLTRKPAVIEEKK